MLVPPSQPGGLRLRILSAAVLIPVALAAIYFGGWLLVLLIAVCAVLLADEWDRLCGGDGVRGPVGIVHAGVILAATLLSGAELYGAALALVAVGAVGVSIIALQFERRAVWPAAGVIYLALPLIAIIWLRGNPEAGRASLLWLFVLVWATDTGALAVGRIVGGPRLAPRISPNKTWSGAAGGLACAAAVGAVVNWLTGDAGIALLVGLSVGMSLAAQLGDLVESAVKRHYGVKDSGSLIPGHGGILDRVDGLLLAAPVMAALALLNDGSALQWR